MVEGGWENGGEELNEKGLKSRKREDTKREKKSWKR